VSEAATAPRLARATRAGVRVRRWAALGDSFTAGHALGEPRWADQLELLLRSAQPGLAYSNLAVPRALSAEVASGQLGHAIDFEPDLLTLICGANDVFLRVRPDLHAFARIHAAMLKRARTALPGAALVTATYPDVTRFLGLRPRSRERIVSGIAELNQLIRAGSRRHGAVCVELAGRADEGERANYAADGLHPSAEGHRRATVAFASALRDRLGVKLKIEIEEKP
jgi:lysophospholipase L1-like esterase